MKHTTRRRWIASAGALALGIGLVGLGAAPASAAPVTSTSDINGAIAANELLIEFQNDIQLDADITGIAYTTSADPLVIDGGGFELDLNGHVWGTILSSVVFRNVDIVDNSATPATAGLSFDLGAGDVVLVDNVSVSSIETGIEADLAEGAQLTITGSSVSDGDTGVHLNSDGSGDVRNVEIHDIDITDTHKGIDLFSGSGVNLLVSGGSITDTGLFAISLTNPTVARVNGVTATTGNIGVLVYHGGPSYQTAIENSSLSGFDIGIASGTSGGSVNVYRTEIFDNDTGIAADGSGQARVSIRESTVRDNAGGGITLTGVNSASFLVDDSTVSGNESTGIRIGLSADVFADIVNSTVSGTTADPAVEGTGGIVIERHQGTGGPFGIDSASAEIRHTTVTDTTAYAGISFSEVPGTVSHTVSAGNDVVVSDLLVLDGPDNNAEVTLEWSAFGAYAWEPAAPAPVIGPGVQNGVSDPGLGPLADNGGPTLTHLPQPGSVLIDAGIDSLIVPALDQRGQQRVYGAAVDIGSVEVVPTIPATGSSPAAAGLAGLALLTLGGLALLWRRRAPGAAQGA